MLRQISINTYIALGMTLIIILGHIDLAVGAIVAMSGTLTVGFVVNQGLPIGVAIAAGIIIGVVAGLIDGMVVSKFRVPAFIITMAMMNVCNGIAYVYSGGQSTRITDKFFIAIGTGYLFNIIPLPVVYMVILIIVFSFLLSKTKFGTYVYAIGGNREAARLWCSDQESRDHRVYIVGRPGGVCRSGSGIENVFRTAVRRKWL